MIDLHCHLLPQIDDGPSSMEEALEMAGELVTAGYSTVAASPHIGLGPGGDAAIEQAAKTREELNDQLNRAGLRLEVLPNAEHYLTVELFERVETGDVVPIGGQGRWLMVELPWGGLAKTEEILFRLQAKGVRILLAHPERHDFVDNKLLGRLVERGIKMQLELGSFIGGYGRFAETRAWDMLDDRLVHVLATDMHRPDGAQLWVPQALQAIRDARGEAAVTLGTKTSPRAVIDDASAENILAL